MYLWPLSSSSGLLRAGRFEQAFVNSLLSERGTSNSSRYYWIGLTDLEKRGEYSWLLHNSTSMPLTFTNWNKHQPGELENVSLFLIINKYAVFWSHVNLLTRFQRLHVFLSSVSAGGCVAMSDGPALGHWEVKDCKSHKALSLCKQSISSYRGVQQPEHHIDASVPCPPGWESRSGMPYCFKVGSPLSFLCAPPRQLS